MMKLTSLKHIKFLIAILSFFCIIRQASAQSSSSAASLSGSVNQMSDQQIMQLWQQAQKGGLSETDAVKMLVKQGLNPSDVNNFKKRLLQLQSSSKSKFNPQSLIKDSVGFMRDSTWIFEIPDFRKKSPYYGFDFFSTPGTTLSPHLNVGTPQDYILGAGDEITVNLTGLNETEITGGITREGNFALPHAGILTLSGLTIEKATDKIRSKMKDAYPALATGKTQLSVTLGNVRSIEVYVIGEAERPSKYTVSSLSGFVNVLYLSGGPTTNGSLRKIELIRNNKVIETVDFYEFLQKGMLAKNIRLENQDVIRFPVYEKHVSLNGEVKRPAIYELLSNETLADLIRYGGGLGDTAYTASAKVVQIGGQERAIRDVDAADFANFIPHNADSVYFDRILARFSNRVYIDGAVRRPGNYELSKNLALSGLIKKAAGLREDAFINRGYIKRRKINADRDFISFDVNAIMTGTAMDIPLLKEDSVFILAKDSLQDIPTISVGGNVRAPGVFQYRLGMSLEDAILMAGGFTNAAATHKVEINRLERNKADTLANQLLSILKVDIDSSLRNAAAKTPIEPMDYVFVPRLLNYTSLGSVKLRGEVLYTGDYALEKRDETIHEVIQRAGGISPYASMSDVQVYRGNLRVATDLLASGGNKFLLLPDDSIYIPRSEPFVEVKGAVFNPQIISYESNSFLSYISDAGGVTDKANLRKAYIQYSNGINSKIHHFLFFRIYPKVLAGSRIIVPEKPEGVRRGLNIVEVSALTGSLSALIGLISILRN